MTLRKKQDCIKPNEPEDAVHGMCADECSDNGSDDA
jgi:hypothetical protein